MNLLKQVMNKVDDIKKYLELYDLYKNLLNSSQREIFEMYFFYDLSYQEISNNKKISRSAISQSLLKTKKYLLEIEEKIEFNKKIKLYKKD